ncbi:MAG: cation transporter [Chlamydiae bacterium]|nr:cation transporter [Chlamydiota bacterium]
MAQFPTGVPLPLDFYQKRERRRKQILQIAMRGVCFRGTIVMAELLGFFTLGSSSLLLDALSSLFDIAMSFLLMLCIRIADKPPDRHHPFGHGRFEPVAGLQLGVFLIVLGGVLAYQQLAAAIQERCSHAISPYAWMIPLGGMILLEIGYRHLKRVATKENSPALLADAVHYRVDSLSCLLATVALAFGAYFPVCSSLLDHIGALMIALFMTGVGIKAAWNNLDQILDRMPSLEYFKRVHQAAMQVEGVLATEKLRIQSYGPDAHISIDIEVDPLLSVELAHAITQKVRLAIQIAWPSVRDVIVHVEPYYANDHASAEWSKE